MSHHIGHLGHGHHHHQHPGHHHINLNLMAAAAYLAHQEQQKKETQKRLYLSIAAQLLAAKEARERIMSEPTKEDLLRQKLPSNFELDKIMPAILQMNSEEMRLFIALNDLTGQRRLNDAKADAFERVLNSVSKNDIKDFMALHGVGSLGRQIEVGIKRTTAEVAQGLLAGLLIVLLLFFGIVLLGLLASLVH